MEATSSAGEGAEEEAPGEAGRRRRAGRGVSYDAYCPVCDHTAPLEEAGERCPKCAAAAPEDCCLKLVAPFPRGSPTPQSEEDKKIAREHNFLQVAMKFLSPHWKANLFWMLRKNPELINAQPLRGDGTKRWSALHQAALKGDPETIKRLVEDYKADCNAEVVDGDETLTPLGIVERICTDLERDPSEWTFISRHPVDESDRDKFLLAGRKEELLLLLKPDASEIVADTFMVIIESGDVILLDSSRMVLRRSWLQEHGCDRKNITEKINSKFRKRLDEFLEALEKKACCLPQSMKETIKTWIRARTTFEVDEEDVSNLLVEKYEEKSAGCCGDLLASAVGQFMPFTNIGRALQLRFQADCSLSDVWQDGRWHFYLTTLLIFVTTQVFNVIKSIGSAVFMATLVWSCCQRDFSNITSQLLRGAVILAVLLMHEPIKALNRALKPRVPLLFVRLMRRRVGARAPLRRGRPLGATLLGEASRPWRPSWCRPRWPSWASPRTSSEALREPLIEAPSPEP